MKIEKLPSGSYRIKKQIDGKRYSFTFDHKPTQKEIADMVLKKQNAVNGKISFEDAANSYIEARTNTISPATIREYKGTLRRLSDRFKRMQVDDITQNDVQREINVFAKDRAPKTVRNYHGFIAGVLGEFRKDLILRTTLPEKDGRMPYTPTADDIKKLLAYAYGTVYEVPIMLGCASLRRGEICALTMNDIEGNVIHITKDVVMDENKNWVVKKPKTNSSIRDIAVPDAVIDAINRNGLYKGHPNSISDWMDKAEKNLGLPHFSLHKCRHYFASESHAQGVPDADIMKAGGWSTDYVMKRDYRQSLAKDNDRAVNAVFSQIL